MSVQKSAESVPVRGHGEIRDKALLQRAITEAFAFLNAGEPREAIAHISQYADLAAPSDIGCYVFGLDLFQRGRPAQRLDVV